MSIVNKDARARSFGQVADTYDRGRPGWPQEAIEWLLGPEPLDVLDLGAGTGKLTAALLAAGHRVTALEPSAGMREVLAERLAGEGVVTTVVDGRAEALPFDDAAFDAVVAGSAFHWFDREPTLEEIGRVLRPPGVFGLLGNRTTPRSTGSGGCARSRAPGRSIAPATGRRRRICAGGSPRTVRSPTAWRSTRRRCATACRP